MTTEQRLSAILAANPGVLRRVDAILSGEIEGLTEPTDRRLLSIQQAADALGVSRTTVWRMLRDGALPCVEIRPGSRRVPSAAITAFVKGGCA
jgi:excisionase family DNA binding protein